jgi:hypothetical protein
MSTDAIRHVVSTPEVEPTEPTQHTNRASTSSPRFAVCKVDGQWRVTEFGIAISMMKPFKTKREAEFACTNYVCIWLKYYATEVQ